jgi:hypothetical protein
MPGGYDGYLYDSEQWPDHLPSLYRVRRLCTLLPGNAAAPDSIAAAALNGDERAAPCPARVRIALGGCLLVETESVACLVSHLVVKIGTCLTPGLLEAHPN